MSRKPSDQLNLRFYEPKRHRSSTVPAAALAQSLDALQRVILLLAMRRDGYTPGRRVRPPANLQHRYRLVCALPTAGSFVAPVQIEGAELLSPAETASLVKEVSNVLAAVGRASEADLEGYLADETWRRFALEAIERLIPDRSSGV